jgi:hypothetical protein
MGQEYIRKYFLFTGAILHGALTVLSGSGVKLVKIQQNMDSLLCVDFNPMYILHSAI